MGKMIVDAATSLDGFCSDAFGQSACAPEELFGAGVSGRLPDTYGAVVMSHRSFTSGDTECWIDQAYMPDTPIFVVADTNCTTTTNGFHYVATYNEAFEAATLVAADRAVLVVGDTTALSAVMDWASASETIEIYLRIVPRRLGKGHPLFDADSPVNGFYVSRLDVEADGVHLQLKARQAH